MYLARIDTGKIYITEVGAPAKAAWKHRTGYSAIAETEAKAKEAVLTAQFDDEDRNITKKPRMK